MMGLRLPVLVASCLLLHISVATAFVAPSDRYDYRVLFDIDSNSATGCDAAAHDANFAGPVPGIEYIFTAQVERFATGAMIDAEFLQTCVSGSNFTDPVQIDAGDWSAGLENGVGGADIVELFLPRDAIGNPASTTLFFHARRTLTMTNDVLLTTNGEESGDPLVLRLPQGQSVPLLSSLALLLCAALLAVLAARRLRHHPSAAAAAVTVALIGSVVATAWAVTITLDGNIADWATVPAIGTDIIGDSSIDDPAEDIVAAFATADGQNIYFRLDLVNLAPSVCGNMALEPGEECENEQHCLIEFETQGGQGGGAGGTCVCNSCSCAGNCDSP
jgi:hypothetical protein